MRIAIAYDCLFPWSKGGGERVYRVFAEEFAAAGHDVVYLTRRQWDTGDEPAIPGVRVEVISEDRELYDAKGNRTLGPAIRFAWALLRHLRTRRHDYDVVFVSAMPATNVPPARVALLGSRATLVVDWLEVWRPDQWREYSGPVLGRVATLTQWLGVRMSPIANCHSQLLATRLRAVGLRGDMLVSPGLIDGDSGAEPQLDPPTRPHVVYVGRHIPDKRVEAIPAAIAHARTEIPDLTATIFGEGRTRDAVAAEVRRLGLDDVIAMPGFVSQQELDAGMRGASCLVNPSMREGYGLVVVEANAVGTPAVLVDGEDNASVELIDPGVNGAVAASVSPRDLGAAIVDVVRAGAPLRKTTRAWYEDAVRTKTVRAAARQILARVTGGPG